MDDTRDCRELFFSLRVKRIIRSPALASEILGLQIAGVAFRCGGDSRSYIEMIYERGPSNQMDCLWENTVAFFPVFQI